jgi:hypothetical protein
MSIDGMRFAIDINGKTFAKGTSDKAVTVPRLGEAELAGTAHVSTTDLMRQVLGTSTLSGLAYRMSGTLFLAGTGGRIAFDLAPQDAPGPRTIAITQPLPVINRPIALVGSDQVTHARSSAVKPWRQARMGWYLQRARRLRTAAPDPQQFAATPFTRRWSGDRRRASTTAATASAHSPNRLLAHGQRVQPQRQPGLHAVGDIDASDAVRADDNGGWVCGLSAAYHHGGGSHDLNMVPARSAASRQWQRCSTSRRPTPLATIRWARPTSKPTATARAA